MNHVSTLRLHQFRLGELTPAVADTVHAHLATCEACANRLGHQRELRLAFQREPIPIAILPAPTWMDRLRSWWWAAALVPVLAATVLAVNVAPADAGSTAETTRPKGPTAGLEAWVQTGSTARPVYTGEHVRAGTRIQLKFNPGSHRFVTLAGRDATGSVEVYGTLAADGPGLATAPFALTLDDTVGEQAFFAVLTDSRPDPGWITSLVRKGPVSTRDAEVASVILQRE